MKYLQKLFIHSMKELYTDIVRLELDTMKCYHVSMEDEKMSEYVIPFEWEEVRQILVDSVCPDDQENVVEKWRSCVECLCEPCSITTPAIF